jgi:RNA polymerase sigma-70 factor (TIGR02943 family)
MPGSNFSENSKTPLNPESWVDQHGDYLYSFARFRVRDQAAAEDLVQETFIAALQNHKNYKGQASERTWLTAILKNKIIDYLRKQSREQPTDDIERFLNKSENLFNAAGKWVNGPGNWSFAPSILYDKKEFWQALRKCLESLPKRLAQAFILREMDGMSHEEICKVLEISSSNSWVVLYRARMGLKKCLGTSWFDRDEAIVG